MSFITDYKGGHKNYVTTTMIFSITHSLLSTPVQNSHDLLLLMSCLPASLIPSVPLWAWVGRQPCQMRGQTSPVCLCVPTKFGPGPSQCTEWTDAYSPQLGPGLSCPRTGAVWRPPGVSHMWCVYTYIYM